MGWGGNKSCAVCKRSNRRLILMGRRKTCLGVKGWLKYLWSGRGQGDGKRNKVMTIVGLKTLYCIVFAQGSLKHTEANLIEYCLFGIYLTSYSRSAHDDGLITRGLEKVIPWTKIPTG